jgi:copper chaperone CopZ
MPGMFKNTIAWLSRPPADIGWVFGGKPVAVLGASPGVIGTVLPRYTHPLHQNPPEHGPDDGSTARTASSPRRDVRGYSPPQAGVCTDIQLTRWRCSLIQTSLPLLSRRSAMIYDTTGQHLTKSFVKETSMSSLFSNPKNPAAFSIRVEGMACDSCVERVEKAIRATPGVVSASVNLATKRAEVTFSGVPDIAAVIAAVGVAGYECMVENASSSNLS